MSVILAALLIGILAPGARADFGFEHLAVTFTEEDGTPVTQAGSHPDTWSTTFEMRTKAEPGQGRQIPDQALKDLRVKLPAGLIGTPALLPRCSRADFLLQSCPPNTAVGLGDIHAVKESQHEAFTLYSLEPAPGTAAEVGFVAVHVPLIVALDLNPNPPYNLIVSVTSATQAEAFFGLVLTVQGLPQGTPFITMPRSCERPLEAIFEADSWQSPGAWVAQPASSSSLDGCAALPFAPTLTAEPTTDVPASPSGLDIALDAPDPGLVSATGTSNADLRAAELNLAPGMTINPAIAAGLAACAPADLTRETATSAPGEGCPQAARIGTAKVLTPLFEDPIGGSIFVAQPDDPASTGPGAENPFDARFALYLILKNPERGVHLTIPIHLDANSDDGRLTATLTDLPQIPINRFELHFNSGPRAPLTAPGCGTHTSDSLLTPSSGAPPLPGAISFTTNRDCPAPAFAPTLSAGTVDNRAGAHSPFLFDLGASAAEPNPAELTLAMPPGLSAQFAAAGLCSEPAAASGACPPDSRIGYARIALGPGPMPLWLPEEGDVPGAVYLAGPYRGAPYSLLMIVPAEAGPYDLGTVITRAAIQIDPETARASVQLDPLPQILAGVPIDYRAIRLILDRPGFIRNPTSCDPTQVTANATSAEGTAATIVDRFQAADCAALGLKPKFSLGLSGGLGRNSHPTATVDVKPRPADANLRAASLSLPYGLFIDPARLRSACPLRRFTEHSCPPSARLGWAQVTSPLLPDPARGRLFMVEGAGRLPDIATSLGGAVPLDLHGHLEARNTRIRASFDSLPDVPLTHLRVVLKGGFRGLLVNSEGLCRRRPPLLRARFLAHNEKLRRIRPRAEVRCPR